MQIILFRHGDFYDWETETQINFDAVRSAVTIGSYDGVHLGHRAILAKLVKSAKKQGLRSVLITFEPHPRLILRREKKRPLKLITTLEEKKTLLAPLGLDVVLVLEFDKAFSEIPAQTFVKDILIKRVGLADIVIGYDHNFGKDRQGTIQTLHSLSQLYGFTVEETEEQLVHGKHVSSTIIRGLLEAGEIDEVNHLLGRPFRLTGKVVEGFKVGRTIGFPTVNLDIANPYKLIPKSGVYVADVSINGICYRSMMNIGFKPTVTSEHKLTIEAHILNFNKDLYGRTLSFALLYKIRDEIKFVNLDALKTQLESDKRVAAAFQREFTCF